MIFYLIFAWGRDATLKGSDFREICIIQQHSLSIRYRSKSAMNLAMLCTGLERVALGGQVGNLRRVPPPQRRRRLRRRGSCHRPSANGRARAGAGSEARRWRRALRCVLWRRDCGRSMSAKRGTIGGGAVLERAG